MIKDLWEMDKRKVREEFERNKKKTVCMLTVYSCTCVLCLGLNCVVSLKHAATETRGNRWSLVTIKMVLAGFVHSPAVAISLYFTGIYWCISG